MNYAWASGSDIGLVRSINQDAVFPTDPGSGPGPLLVIVADGMGGHAAGDVASRLAVETAVGGDERDPTDRITDANLAVVEASTGDPALAGMGTTMSMALIEPSGRAVLGHVGDSRIYLWREQRLEQLSRDHTYVAELVESGRIDADEAANHPHRHMITRALGSARSVKVDRMETEFREGDRLVLCSDGLTTMVDDTTIARILGDADDPVGAVWDLIEAANRAGGVDNTTVAVVDVLP